MEDRVTITIERETVAAIIRTLSHARTLARLDLSSRYSDRRAAAAIAVERADRIYQDAEEACAQALGIDPR